MILYDFQCMNEKCKYQFEEYCPLDKKRNIKCPKCKSKTEKIITNPKHYQHLSWSSWRVGNN